MLWPSDVAPHAKVFNGESFEPLIMTTKQIVFKNDGSCVIRLLGIKNDYHRDGFEIPLVPSQDAKVNPVSTLKCYIERTKYIRSERCPLFLSLKSPYSAISALMVTTILEKAIIAAGLKGQGFSAKCFHPTGATNAVQGAQNPDFVRKIGHWKNRETFEDYYVHSQPPKSFTDTVLQVQDKC